MTLPPTADTLIAAILAGKTLYVATATRVTPINAKTVRAFERAGVPVLKTGKDGHLYLAQGRKYVDCTYCSLTLQ